MIEFGSSVRGRRHEKKPMRTVKRAKKPSDDLKTEYDLSALGPGVRGKYFRRASAGTNLVLIEPDLAKAFPTGKAVNNALRMLVDVAAVAPAKKRRTHRRAV